MATGEAVRQFDIGLQHVENMAYQTGASYFEESCDGGIATACHNLELLYRYGFGVEKDNQMAAIYFEVACDGGALKSCHELGFLYNNGLDMDYKMAIHYYEKACSGGESASCNALGVMYRFGRGVTKNDKIAKEYYQKSCD